MAADQFDLATRFLRAMDTGGDVFQFLTDDVVVTYPKWGAARGKAELVRLYRDLAPYLRSTTHHAESFRTLAGDGELCIAGVSSGALADGRTWAPDGGCRGQFCVWFRFAGGLISAVTVYIDPDYVDGTQGYYPWQRPGH
jgi:hypothetical protein